jgi:CheY-like chemotaxis protein
VARSALIEDMTRKGFTMFKHQEDEVAVLGICIDEPAQYGRVAGVNYMSATSGRRAIEMLRMMSFDFALVGIKLPDVSTWDLVRTMRTGFPYLKWALVGGPITEQQEITARMFGATTLFDTTPSTHEIVGIVDHQRKHAAALVVSGKAPRPAASAAGQKVQAAV